MNDYRDFRLHRRSAFFRFLLVALPFSMVGFGLVGILAHHSVFRNGVWIELESSSDLVERILPLSKGIKSSAFDHWGRVWKYTREFPIPCIPGQSVNEFQKEKCRKFLRIYGSAVFVALLPGILGLLAFGLIWSGVSHAYLRGRFSLKEKKPRSKAVVTQPAQGPPSFFSWIFCLEVLCVQRVSDEAQLLVYVPKSTRIPQPGQEMAIFLWGPYLGKDRFIALEYLPYLKIVRGVDEGG